MKEGGVEKGREEEIITILTAVEEVGAMEAVVVAQVMGRSIE